MASQRNSDENLNPDTNDTPRKVLERKRLSTEDRKSKTRFVKSGMKKGALVQFLTVTKRKREDEDEDFPKPPQQAARVMSDKTRNTNGSAPVDGQSSTEANNNICLDSNTENGEEAPMANSQDSSVIFEGEFCPLQTKDVELVEIRSKSDQEDDNEIGEGVPLPSNGNSPASPCEEVPSDPSPDNRDSSTSSHSECNEVSWQQQHALNIESGLNLPEFETMSTCDKVERWQQENKRVHQNTSMDNDEDSFRPSPNKTSRHTPSKISEGEHASDRSSVSSFSGSPKMKIINVYSVAPATQTNKSSNVTVSLNEPRASSSSYEHSSVKDVSARYKEIDNPQVGAFIQKKNWSRALKAMDEDFSMQKLPRSTYVSNLVRRAILRDGSRVAKQVQVDSMQFLEKLVDEYPPSHGNRSDLSVKYYKEIFENVFEEENEDGLHYFLDDICRRVEDDLSSKVESYTLRLLVLVTNLVFNQFKEYGNVTDKDIVKVKPPLFQHFLEDKEGKFLYDPCCTNIVDKLFATKAREMICIYLKWLDLIAKRCGSFSFHKKENEQLVMDVAQHCRDRNDLGLFCFLNLEYRPFSKQVCEKLFERLSVISKTRTINPAKIDDIRRKYLKKLAKTLLIKSAETVISDLYIETSPIHEALALVRTTMERDLELPQTQDKKKNVKGETRLHKLCNSKTIEDPLDEFRKAVMLSPHDVNEPDNFGNTLLHDCAVQDKGNIIVQLMTLYRQGKIQVKINFLARNRSLETPMHLAAVHCSSQHAEILKHFVRFCGDLDEVLMAPNGEGKLPFEVAEEPIKNKLKPEAYEVEDMLVHDGITIDADSIEKIKNCFPLRILIAWWNKFGGQS